MGNFEGTVTFITGASSGIGAAVAKEIAHQGGNVILVARREDRLKALAEEIEGMGRKALIAVCDITRDADLKEAVARADAAFGRIDYVFANAGFGVAGRFERLALDDFRRQFDTNVFGVVKTIQATRDHLIASRGCLAITGSVNGYIATPRLSAYCMSKFAVHGLADALRYELRPHGVGVVLIVPGYIATEVRRVDKQGVFRPETKDRIPRWLVMSPDKAARQIVRALHKRKREKIITLHALFGVLLQRYVPGLVFTVISHFSRKKRRPA
jgi:short-subunit dehydrogenase